MFRAAPFTLALITSAVFATAAQAAEFKPFSQAVFEAARTTGRPIVIEVNAPWCPVCASQAKTIQTTVADPAYSKLLILRIDFDTQKSEWQRFNVTKQSTLIAFKNGREVGRVSYITDKTKIQNLLALTQG
ncbi:MAG: thioredoxin family protein [Sphingomonadaceae bacterium]